MGCSDIHFFSKVVVVVFPAPSRCRERRTVQYFHGDDGALLHSTATLGAAAFTLSFIPPAGEVGFNSLWHHQKKKKEKRIIIHKEEDEKRGQKYI